jgi:rhodanese-related sulfurtransferase
MDENADRLQAVIEEQKKIREELDRKVFHFRTLHDTARELEGIIQPGKIMDGFLLMTIGSLGISRGLVALFNARTLDSHVVGRGFSPSAIAGFKESLPQFHDRYFARRDIPADSPPRVQIVKDNLPDHALLPSDVGTLILWSMDQEYSGVVGLGPKISGEVQSEEDSYLLLNLTHILIGALSRAIFTMNIQQLNADLQKKNAVLEDALSEVGRAREELDRRVYHLKTLSDLNAELSPIISIPDLLQTYLLVTMGTFGIKRGFALYCDREAEEAEKVRFVIRGGEAREVISFEAAEKLLYKSFEASETRMPAPMSISRILNAPGLFAEAQIGIEAGTGLLYLIDRASLGVIGFGPKISGEALSREEEDLLFTHTAGFMVFLRNAKAFEKINGLNEGLVRKNEELRKTIAELTDAKHKIALLEKVRVRIKSIVQRELERSGRMNPLDIGLITLVAVVVAVLFNFANPHGIRILPETLLRPASSVVDAREAKSLLDSGMAVLVDARPKEFFEQKHITGAINLPPALFDLVYMMKLSKLDLEKEIIVYGRTISKLYDEDVAYRLKQRDHEKVRVLTGGLDELKTHGYQVEP